MAITLFFAPLPSFADGCDVHSYETDSTGAPGTGWIQVIGNCTSSAEAQQGCIGIAEQHGYTSDYCYGIGDPAGTLAWEAGWLKESQFGGPSGNGVYPPFYLLRFYYPQYFVSAYPQAQCDICLGDPVNPANGAMFLADMDIKEQGSAALPFERFYNSTRPGSSDLSSGWRHSFNRSLTPKYSALIYKPYQQNSSDNSSLYGDVANACTNGFVQIKSRVNAWVNAVVSYANGVCNIMVNGTIASTLPIYSTVPAPFGGSTLTSIDVIRDDGELITFALNDGSIVAPPNISLRLQQTGTGYALSDEKDNVEAYDTNGRLLSVTSGAGVVQTMSYDTSGLLSGVTNNFGHQLILTYNTQNRLITVTRQ